MMDPVCHVGASVNPSQFVVPEDMQHLGIVGIGDGHHGSFVNSLIYSQETDEIIMESDELATEIVGEIMPVPETVAQQQEVIHMDLARDESSVKVSAIDSRERSESPELNKEEIEIHEADVKQEEIEDETGIVREEVVVDSSRFFMGEDVEDTALTEDMVDSDFQADYSQNEAYEDGEVMSGYSCMECGAVLKSKAEAKRHLIVDHNYQCTSKKKYLKLQQQQQAQQQQRVISGNSPTGGSFDESSLAMLQIYQCPSCTYSSHRRDKLDKHVMKHVLQDGYHPCGKKRHRPEAPPQRHRHNAEEYHCPYCPYGCTVYKALRKHKKLHTQGKSISPKISCKVCGKDRSCEEDMAKHMRKHRQGENFVCDLCGFTSIQLKKIIQHRRMHTGEKPHLCPHCSYRSARRDNLRSHVRRMHKRDNMYIDTFNPTESATASAGIEEFPSNGERRVAQQQIVPEL